MDGDPDCLSVCENLARAILKLIYSVVEDKPGSPKRSLTHPLTKDIFLANVGERGKLAIAFLHFLRPANKQSILPGVDPGRQSQHLPEALILAKRAA